MSQNLQDLSLISCFQGPRKKTFTSHPAPFSDTDASHRAPFSDTDASHRAPLPHQGALMNTIFSIFFICSSQSRQFNRVSVVVVVVRSRQLRSRQRRRRRSPFASARRRSPLGDEVHGRRWPHYFSKRTGGWYRVLTHYKTCVKNRYAN